MIAIEATEEQLAAVRYDERGLVPVIAQDLDGVVLMFAWMNEQTLRMTLESGRMVYWSRSRQEVWPKGDTSGNYQVVHDALYDCDADVLLFRVDQQGDGACHTGAYSCFSRRFGAEGTGLAHDGRPFAPPLEP